MILNLTPRSDPFAEVAPGGQRSLVETERPRADRANETLIDLLSEAANAGADGTELAEHLRELGARVASNVKDLAKSLSAANFDLDASWLEPGQPTARPTVSASVSSWLAQFVDGQALDSYEDELIGVAHTLSDVARWRIDTEDGPRYVDVSELPPEAFEVPRRNLGGDVHRAGASNCLSLRSAVHDGEADADLQASQVTGRAENRHPPSP